MKKLLIAVALVVATAVQALEWKAQSFLTVTSITTSNTYGVTNLYSGFATSAGTNNVGLIYTNKAGARIQSGVVATYLTNEAGTISSNVLGRDVNLVGDVPFSPLVLPVLYFSTNSSVLASPFQGNAAIVVSCTAGASADQANTFRFIPLYDGVRPGTVAGEAMVFAVTPAGATRVTIKTNINFATQFHNCKAIRLESITPGDVDAASQVTWDTISLIQLVP